MDIIKRVKKLCTGSKYGGSITTLTLQIVPMGGETKILHYPVFQDDSFVTELFDRSLSGYFIACATMSYYNSWELILLLVESDDHTTNISGDVIEVISTLSKKR